MAFDRINLRHDLKSFDLDADESLLLCQNGVLFEFSSGDGYPANSQSYFCQQGLVYLSNKRIVYIPHPPKGASFQSLLIPIENISFISFRQSKIFSPKFVAELLPMQNSHILMKGKLQFEFKNGGGFSFHELFSQLKLRIQELGSIPQHVEELPVYQGYPRPTQETSLASPNCTGLTSGGTSSAEHSIIVNNQQPPPYYSASENSKDPQPGQEPPSYYGC